MTNRKSHRRSCEPFCDLKALRKRSQRGRGVKEFLEQKEWFVGGECAREDNSGTCEESPTTFDELARRLSKGLVGPGNVTITILDDLGEEDCVGFDDIVLLEPGTNLRIQGVRKVLQTGTLTEVVEKDRFTNTPDQVAGSPDLLAIGIDKVIRIPRTGSVAYGAVERNGLLQVSTWTNEAIDEDGFASLGEPPMVGDVYEIVDYPKVFAGRLTVSIDPCPTPEALGSTFGLAFLHVARPDFEFRVPFFWPNTTADGDGTYVSNCIIDQFAQTGAKSLSANNLIRGSIEMRPGAWMLLVSGLFHPIVGTGYPGGIRQETATVVQDGDTMFVGSGTPGVFDPESPTFFTPADWQVFNSNLFATNLSFWNTNHGIFPGLGGAIFFNAFGEFFGEPTGVQLWGDGNVATITFIGGANTMTFEQFSPDIILPTLVGGTGPGGPVFNLINPRTTAYAWHPDLGIFSPAPGRQTTWANFDVPFPAGFKVIDDEQTVFPNGVLTLNYSNATQSSEHDSVFFDVFFFEPAP